MLGLGFGRTGTGDDLDRVFQNIVRNQQAV